MYLKFSNPYTYSVSLTEQYLPRRGRRTYNNAVSQDKIAISPKIPLAMLILTKSTT